MGCIVLNTSTNFCLEVFLSPLATRRALISTRGVTHIPLTYRRRTPTCVVLRGLDTIKDEAIMDDIVFCLSATTTSLRMDILCFNPTQGNHDHLDDNCNRDNNNDKFVITVLKTSRQVVKVTLRHLHHPDDSSHRNFDGRKRHGPCIKSGKMPRHVR
ncbi:hypothetical protein EDB86DRAFT_2831457 [Lactarius hatsudake]|nr:hypothetical protein EDB86DRAFT_2831457 [Lactarius hatsudake]